MHQLRQVGVRRGDHAHVDRRSSRGRRRARSCGPAGSAAASPAARSAARRSRRGTACRRSRVSIRPRRCAWAPVKAPFSWPNSSLSSSASGIAPQLIGTKGPSARALSRWIARAASSLPVPLSPSTSTGASTVATLRIEREHLLHARAGAEHALEGRRGVCCRSSRFSRSSAWSLQRAAQHHLELLDVDRLDEEVVGALVDRAQRVSALLAPGDHHDLGARVRREQLLERREAFLDAAGMRRQPEVERHHGGPVGSRALARPPRGSPRG